jgi:hypothetical protein
MRYLDVDLPKKTFLLKVAIFPKSCYCTVLQDTKASRGNEMGRACGAYGGG